MDRITETLLNGFAAEYEIVNLPVDKKFERFSAFSTIRRHFTGSIEIEGVMMGGSGDTSIDAIAIIVNNVLVTDIDEINELAEATRKLDVSFIFVQASHSSSFAGYKIGDFGFGVRDFFETKPKITRNNEIKKAAEIADAIFQKSEILSRPNCHLYYVTTGKWTEDNDLVARRDGVVADLEKLGIFSTIRFDCIDADRLQGLYQQTKNAITCTFEFKNRNDLPTTAGVNQAFLGYVPFSEFRKIISNNDGTEIISSIFYDNVRDWQDYNAVNEKIKETLLSSEKSRFVLMNNGVTIIARQITPIGTKYTISDFQIVNGCQTSNVLFDQRNNIDDSVCVPLRLIETRDEAVMDAIIRATNSQTDVKPEQYFARLKFVRRLEQYFAAFDEAFRLHYERRDGQYDRGSETKTRIVSTNSVIRSFAAMYMEIPHSTTRGYTSVRNRVGADVFGDEHQLEPYYAASYASYVLETRFRTKNTAAAYKPARYHILLAARLLVDPNSTASRSVLILLFFLHDLAERASGQGFGQGDGEDFPYGRDGVSDVPFGPDRRV